MNDAKPVDNIIPDDFTDEDLGPDEDKWHQKPMLFILGVILALLVIMMVVPFYGVRLDPEPRNIPTLASVLPSEIEAGNLTLTSGERERYLELVEIGDPVLKQIADKIVSESCASGQRVCHAKALFNFVRDEFDYVPDPLAYEYVKNAKLSLVSQGGDCDDASILLANLLGAIGVKTRFVFVPGHVYVQAEIPNALPKYMDNGWINLDATCSYCAFGEIALPYANARKSYVG